MVYSTLPTPKCLCLVKKKIIIFISSAQAFVACVYVPCVCSAFRGQKASKLIAATCDLPLGAKNQTARAASALKHKIISLTILSPNYVLLNQGITTYSMLASNSDFFLLLPSVGIKDMYYFAWPMFILLSCHITKGS